MSATNSPFRAKYIFNPAFWPTWLGFAFLWLVTKLPYRLILALGSALGFLIMLLMAQRRRISRTNICLCFPDLTRRQQRRLLRQSFYSNGQAVFESALTWWGSPRKLKNLTHIEGLEHLEEAQKQGKGIILLGAHYATMEICGRIAAMHIPGFIATYKKVRNPLFEAMITHSRNKLKADTILSTDMRGILRELKNDKVIWYAPDQDFGDKKSVFAPFMGVQTSTLTLTSRLAKLSGAVVLPWYGERLKNNKGYKFSIGPELENFPSDDDVADATQLNASIEKQVRRIPEQYLWGHRRFKTRPIGEAQVYQPRRDRALKRYSLAMFLLAIPIAVYTLILAYRNQDKRYLAERFGRYPSPVEKLSTDFWFHASSVGEVIALLPLIERLQQLHPEKNIVLSTFTPTGGKIACQRLPDGVKHVYLPIDYVFSVKRFLTYINPRCAMIMETELWPNLFEYCYNYAIPIVIINGRLSKKSLQTKGWINYLMHRAVNQTSKILAKSDQEKEHFKRFSAKENKITVTGNLKYAAISHEVSNPIKLSRPYILIASTHEDEEIQIAKRWQASGDIHHILVIAPRHPHRSDKILTAFKQKAIACPVRSENERVDEYTEFYLADTFGELNQFIAGASFVVMGGSFVPVGGHNILEVAAQKKAVVFGPYMHNFAEERQQFLDANAALEATDYDDLMRIMRRLIDSPELCDSLGSKSNQLLQSQTEILNSYIEQLELFFTTYKIIN